jgi:exodeoxyribonuclease VII large subunit
VQGDGSAEHIAAALRNAAAIQSLDLILLTRGGGSLEDLWEFNEEIVARAIAASRMPVITGIGHEIDVSISDLVADYHAHTPTEAAQVAVRHWRNAADLIGAAGLRLRRQVKTLLDQSRQRLAHAERHEFFRRPLDRINQLRQLLDDRERSLLLGATARLRIAHDRTNRLDARLRERHPRHLMALQEQRASALSQRLTRATGEALQSTSRRLDLLAARLHCVNPQEVLKRGYSLTTHKKSGQIIKDPAQVKPGDALVTRLANGQIESKVEDTRQLKLFE